MPITIVFLLFFLQTGHIWASLCICLDGHEHEMVAFGSISGTRVSESEVHEVSKTMKNSSAKGRHHITLLPVVCRRPYWPTFSRIFGIVKLLNGTVGFSYFSPEEIALIRHYVSGSCTCTISFQPCMISIFILQMNLSKTTMLSQLAALPPNLVEKSYQAVWSSPPKLTEGSKQILPVFPQDTHKMCS